MEGNNLPGTVPPVVVSLQEYTYNVERGRYIVVVGGYGRQAAMVHTSEFSRPRQMERGRCERDESLGE